MPSLYKFFQFQNFRLARNYTNNNNTNNYQYNLCFLNLSQKRFISWCMNERKCEKSNYNNHNNNNINNNNNNNKVLDNVYKQNKEKCLHYTAKEGYFRSSPFETITELPNLTLDKYVWHNLNKWQNKIATVDIVTGRKYTYSTLRDCSAALAIRLQKQFKLIKGDVLAICMPNSPEYPIAVLGAIEAGLTVTTINPAYTSEEISHQLTFSRAKFLIGNCNAYSILEKACQLSKKSIPIACLRFTTTDPMPNNAIDFQQLFTPDKNFDFNQLEKYDIDINEMTLLPFSSGTTGLPKGVMLPHKCITTNAEQINIVLPMDGTDRQEVVPAILPFYHIYGLTVVMLSRLSIGCQLVTMPQFKPDDLIKCFTDYKATIMNLVPPLILFMINSPKVNAEIANSMHMVLSGAAPLGLTDVERFLKKFPKAKLLQGFGMTETSPVVFITPITNTRYASTGFLVSNTEAKIIPIDSDKTEGLPANQPGELLVRGPQVMSGYFKNEKATQDTFCENNWLRTGDVAYFDDDGYFYITDRIKELIKVKGFQVPPAELEALLRHHPKIAEAAVFGISHPFNGEAPKALVVLKPNTQATEDEIYNYVSERVAHYKRLDGGILFTDEIPKNPSGKILRRVLKEKYSS